MYKNKLTTEERIMEHEDLLPRLEEIFHYCHCVEFVDVDTIETVGGVRLLKDNAGLVLYWQPLDAKEESAICLPTGKEGDGYVWRWSMGSKRIPGISAAYVFWNKWREIRKELRTLRSLAERDCRKVAC